MADNVAVTAGSGTTVATDDVSGVHYAKVKIIDGTAESTTPLPVATEGAAAKTDGLMLMGRYDSTVPTAVDDGDATLILTDANGRPRVSIENIATPLGQSLVDDTSDVLITSQTPRTSGGLSIFRSLDLDESEEEVKATAGQVYGWFITNLASSTRYVKFYNATAANVTVGTTTPVITIPLEADQAANVEFTNGIAFSTAITVAATTGIADNDTGAPGANEVVVNIFYK